jgi:hypothetical protein
MLNRTICVVAIILLAAHAPLGLNDGLIMDDWLVLKPRPDYAVDLDFLLRGAGHPIFFGYYSLANLTLDPILFMKTAALTAIFCGCICLFLAARRSNLLSETEAVGFSLIVWTYPGYQIWAGKGNAVYVVSFGFFCIGAWLLTLAWSAKGPIHVALRVATALAFFLSFALNSTMVLFAFTMLGLFVAVWRASQHEHGSIQHFVMSAWRCISGYPELVLLPFIYWGILNIWFARSGVYSGHYNAHIPALGELMDGWRVFFTSAYRSVLAHGVRAAADNRISFALAACLVASGFLLLRPTVERSLVPAKSVVLPLLLSPIVFLALSLPYLIAGLRASDHFYESRHLLMFGVPSALGLLAIKRMAEKVIGARAAFFIVFGLASTLSIAILWNGYAFMQARALKQQALSNHLASMPKPGATVFNVDDGFRDYPSQRAPFGIPEVTGMLRLAWGNQPFLGFTSRIERPTVLQEMELHRTSPGSAYHHIDPSGPQATISFQPGPAAVSYTALAQHYYACRLLLRCDVPAFLMQLGLVTINVAPIAGLTPLDHRN